MAIKDAVITLKGDQAVVRKIEIMQEKDGSYKVAVFGETKDSTGRLVGLDIGLESAPIGTAILDNIWAHGLPVLRKANGLE